MSRQVPPSPVVREYSSRALTDTTCVLLWTPLSRLRPLLEPLGLDLVPVRGAPRAMHPIWLDLGHIKSGTGEALKLDQHAWWQRTGAAAGSALGWASGVSTTSALRASLRALEQAANGSPVAGLGSWWSAMSSYWEGVIEDARDAGAAGAAYGQSLGVNVAEKLSRGLSRTLGTYREAIVGTPNVVAAQRHGGPYSLVLGMYTDSPIALWGDRTLRYGYRKRLCQLATRHFESYTARSSDGQPLLTAEISVAAPSDWQSASKVSGLDRVLGLVSQPLLGHLERDQFAVSYLERDYAVAEPTRLAPSRVSLQWAPSLTAGLASGEVEIPALGRRAPWGAFSARDVPTRVTYPEHRSLAEL